MFRWLRSFLDHRAVRRRIRNYAQHRWVGQRAGSAPDMAESYEYVSYCGVCGCENHGDPAEFPWLDYPPCEGDGGSGVPKKPPQAPNVWTPNAVGPPTAPQSATAAQRAPDEGDDDEPWLRELARAPAPDPEASLAAEDTATTGRPRVDCPVCGHFSHRKNACRGGMGDYCDCPADDREQAPPPAPRPGVPV